AAQPPGRRGDHAECHLFAEARAHDRAQIAEAVDEAEFEGAPAGPELAAEQRLVIPFQAGAAAAANLCLEALVDVPLQSFEALYIFGILRPKWIEHRFAAASGVDTALDTYSLQQILEAKAGADHSDRSDDRRLVGEDFVAGSSQPVAAGCR